MTALSASHLRYRFFDCVLDPSRRELLVDGRVVPLQARCFDLLVLLVSQAGVVVSKDDLIAHVWPTQHVTDAVLTSAIARIRRTVGESAALALRNVHGIGYRFDGEVRSEAMLDSPVDVAAVVPPVAVPVVGLYGDVGGDDFWQSQWQRGLSLARTGSVSHALDVLLTARPHLPPGADASLAVAALLRQRGLLLEAKAEIDAALAGIGQLAPTVPVRARLLIERSRIAFEILDYVKANEDCWLVLDLLAAVDDAEGNAGLLPEVLALQARCMYLSGAADASEVLRHLEGVLEMPRDVAACVSGHLTRSSLLHRQGQLDDAMSQAKVALAIAQEHGMVLAQADALVVMSTMLFAQMHVIAGLHAAQRAQGLCGVQADLLRYNRIRYHVLHGYLELGELTQASAVLDELDNLPTSRTWTAATFNREVVSTHLIWRSGRMAEALATAQPNQTQPNAQAHVRQLLDERYALWHISAGDSGPALALLESKGIVLSQSTRALLNAGVALLQGDREAATSHLRRAWLAQGINSSRSLRVIWSLALLQIEDGDTKGLDACMAELATIPPGHPAADLIRTLHAMKIGGETVDEARLQGLVRRNCGLVNRHGWLLEPGGIQTWLSGQRKLSELFDIAWF
jgi:DNA-binding winged helix-turn-helix (wHTH) protein/tetratricopeptide (TPR) repeat protein